MNFRSLSVIYSSESLSVATIFFTTKYTVSDASVALFININFTSLINQSVIISMLLYSFYIIRSLDLNNFIIKSITINFYNFFSIAINFMSL